MERDPKNYKLIEQTIRSADRRWRISLNLMALVEGVPLYEIGQSYTEPPSEETWRHLQVGRCF
jgi:hypothetical protein